MKPTQPEPVSDDEIAARLADFDINFPIPKIEHDITSLRYVSSGECTVTEPVVGVCSAANAGE